MKKPSEPFRSPIKGHIKESTVSVPSFSFARGKSKFFYGWVIALAGAVVAGSGWGMQYSFGIFFKPMLAEFGWSRASGAGAFSICMVVLALTSMPMGWLSDRFGSRLTIAVSGLLISLGTFLTGHISNLWQLYIYYGLLVGMGMAANYAPIMAMISRWFVEKRGLASGIVAAGIGGGTMLIAPLARYSIDIMGWRQSYYLFGLALFITMVGFSLFLSSKPEDYGLLPLGASNKDSSRFNAGHTLNDFSLREATKTVTFWLIFLSNMLWTFGLFIPVVHVVAYATDLGIKPLAAATIMSILGGASIIGKILSGVVSDKIGNKNTLLASLILQAAMMFWLLWSKNLSMFYIFAILYGFSYGGVVPQFPIITGKFFGLAKLGAIFGLVSSGGYLGNASGPALAGYIFDVSHSYRAAFFIGGLSLIFSLLLSLFLKKPLNN